MMTNTFSDTGRMATVADWQVPSCLAKLAALRPTQMCEMIDAYIMDTTVRLATIRAALRNNRLEVVSKEAHSMIGSSSQMGAGDLAQMLRTTEVAAKGGAADAAGESVDALMRSFAEISRSMTSYAARIRTPN